MNREQIDMREPNAWRKLTRWQRWMAALNDRFSGNTDRILEHLAKERGWKPYAILNKKSLLRSSTENRYLWGK